MTEHELKCYMPEFAVKWNGTRHWDFQKQENFKEGDLLIQKEYDPVSGLFTGRSIEERVTKVNYLTVQHEPTGFIIMDTKLIRIVYGPNDESKNG